MNAREIFGILCAVAGATSLLIGGGFLSAAWWRRERSEREDLFWFVLIWFDIGFWLFLLDHMRKWWDLREGAPWLLAGAGLMIFGLWLW